MTDDTTRGDATAAADPAELEQRLAQAEERLTFYTSFDKLIQDNIARSSELMRDALALREQAIDDMRRAQAELERVQAEAAQAVAAANTQAVDERRRFGETLLALHGELGSLQDAAAAIGRQVGSVLGELGAAEFVPVSWTPAEPAGDSVVTDEAIEEAVEELETALADSMEAEVWNPLAEPGEDTITTGELIAYQGAGTGELSMEGAGDDMQVAEHFPPVWEAEIPAYAAVDAELGDAVEEPEVALEAEPVEAPVEAMAEDGEAQPIEAEAEVLEAMKAEADLVAENDDFASIEDFEAAVAALEAAEADDAVLDEVVAVELEEVLEEADAEEAGAEAEAVAEFLASEIESDLEASDEAEEPVAAAESGNDVVLADAELEPSIPGPDDIDVYAADGYDPPPAYREEGFLGGFAAEADEDDAPAAEAAYESAVAVETADEPRAVMVLVHGVPRAAAALSLQRHLASLDHVNSVEAREYAEGILRLQVTARTPLELDDLRAWDGGTELEPVHVQEDVIEVRLPGALGF